MFDKIKKIFDEKKFIKKKDELYNFDDNNEKESKKLKKIDLLDRIKFIKFNKGNEKNSDVNMRKIKEVRSFSYSSGSYRNRIY